MAVDKTDAKVSTCLQVSLNQVGPLMYEVLGPNEVFERRW